MDKGAPKCITELIEEGDNWTQKGCDGVQTSFCGGLVGHFGIGGQDLLISDLYAPGFGCAAITLSSPWLL
jgi:hypothetical protein